MTYSKIETLLEIILGNNNLEELKKNTSELIFLVDKMFIEFTGNSFFCTFLISKILNPLTDKILEINPENHNSRSRIKLKNTIAKKKKILTDLRNKIINTYKNHLIDSDVYKDYISEKINKINFIINPDVTLELLNFELFKSLIDNSYDTVVNHFEKQYKLERFEIYKQELFDFVRGCELKIKELNNYQITISQKLIQLDNNSDLDIKYSLTIEKEINAYHINKLKELVSYLYENHLILRDIKREDEIPLTVFGNRNFDKIENLYNELIELINISPSKKDFTEVFKIDNIIQNKINLSKHFNSNKKFTLSDYGYLISTLQEFFIESIKQNNTEYDNWWAERFKFESIDKSFKDIRKMKSNAKKDVNRKPKYKTEIDSLKDIFY